MGDKSDPERGQDVLLCRESQGARPRYVPLGDASKSSQTQKGRTPTSVGSRSAKYSRNQGFLLYLWVLQGHGTEQAAVMSGVSSPCRSLSWCCPRQPGEGGEHHPVWKGASQDMPQVARPLNQKQMEHFLA